MTKTQELPAAVLRELEEASKRLDTKVARRPVTPTGEPMRILHSDTGGESPLEVLPGGPEGIAAYSGDYWGTFSLEKFASAGSLSYTHEDAWGWLKYLEKFKPRNFRYIDNNVRIWAYYDQYDNWQDTYGLDAVLAVYHSGHGGMTGDGRFFVPLGAHWGGLGTTAWSDRMQLGNEQMRYIFWSTCLSCRVLGGHNPIRTWHPANRGFRMLFGYETISYDDPDYGKAFWKHWNKGKSFSTAFMDASWHDVSHRQAPSVVACGSTKAEAKNRVFNERKLYWGSVSRNWYWWRWYNAAGMATAARALNQELPRDLLVAELAPVTVDGRYVQRVLERHDLGLRMPREVKAGPDGVFSLRDGDLRAAFEDDGTYEVEFARPNLENTDQISLDRAKGIAEDFLRAQVDDRSELVFDRIMLSQEGGGTSEGSGQLEGPFVTETTVQFTQRINGLPVLGPSKGGMSVTVDNDGEVTTFKNSMRTIDRLTDRLKSSPAAPDEERPMSGEMEPKRLLAMAWQDRIRDWSIRGAIPEQYNVVPGTYEIGYAMKGASADLVARQDIEVDCGNECFKRYAVEVPLFE